MCGLFGWIVQGTEVPWERLAAVTRHLAYAMERRGTDGAGIAYQRIGAAKPVLHKGTLPARQAWETWKREAPDLFMPGTRWLIGHTRQATVGAATLANAHPFYAGNTVGAHNGQVINYAALAVDQTRYTLPECDSAALLAYIDQVGPAKAISQAWGTLRLTLAQAPWEAVSLYPDGESQLSVAYVRTWKAALWCSDESVLVTALALADVRLGGVSKRVDGYLCAVQGDMLYTIAPAALGGLRLRWTPRQVVSGIGGSYGLWKESGRPENGMVPLEGPTHYDRLERRWHRGLRDVCSTCAPYAAAPWYVYKRKGGLPRLRTGPTSGTLSACLNCGAKGGIAEHAGKASYVCRLCGARQVLVGKEITQHGGNGYAGAEWPTPV